MTTFLAAFGLFVLAVVGMAIGAMFGRGGLCGSCGGLSAMRDKQGHPLCDGCSHPEEGCSEKTVAENSSTEISSTAD